MDAAAPNAQIDRTHGQETGEFLGQILSYQNRIVGHRFLPGDSFGGFGTGVKGTNAHSPWGAAFCARAAVPISTPRWRAVSASHRRSVSNPVARLSCGPPRSKVMKISARNQIKGKILDVKKGATTAHIRLEIGPGQIITSSITNEAVDELGLKAGITAFAVIKASEVMIAVE
jgi:molybdopterin-binding protein